MTDEELERMRAYAEAAREHPTWSVAYAQDVPKLLAVIERLTSALDQVMNDGSLEPIERRQIATHALAGVVYREPVEHDRLWHRLRFAEMVLDRLNAEIDGVPWREAARLGESLDGEPVTEPVAPDITLGVGSGSGDGRDGLFVHGSHEAIARVRERMLRDEPLEKRIGECEHAVATLTLENQQLRLVVQDLADSLLNPADEGRRAVALAAWEALAPFIDTGVQS